MALPVWRETVPHVPNSGTWGIEKPWRDAESSGFESGVDRFRGRSGPVTLSWARTMTGAQFAEFQEMVLEDFKLGKSMFIMPVFRKGRTCVEKTCQLMGATYQANAIGVKVEVSLTLYVWDYYS